MISSSVRIRLGYAQEKWAAKTAKTQAGTKQPNMANTASLTVDLNDVSEPHEGNAGGCMYRCQILRMKKRWNCSIHLNIYDIYINLNECDVLPASHMLLTDKKIDKNEKLFSLYRIMKLFNLVSNNAFPASAKYYYKLVKG